MVATTVLKEVPAVLSLLEEGPLKDFGPAAILGS